MIKVGINENVFLANSQIDEKGNLELQFKEKADADKPKIDNYFDVLAADATVIEGSDSMSIRIFPPLPPREDSDRTKEKKVELLVSDINKTKGILLHILKGYYTQEELKGKINPFRGLDHIKANFEDEIQKKEILEQIHRNLATDFIAAIKPHLNKEEELFRLLLVRQSKEKHFATFRNRYIEDNPFWESMAIPKEQSKVKFTPYELREGLNDGTPLPKSAADSKDAPAGGSTASSAPLTAANVFGNG